MYSDINDNTISKLQNTDLTGCDIIALKCKICEQSEIETVKNQLSKILLLCHRMENPNPNDFYNLDTSDYKQNCDMVMQGILYCITYSSI